MTSAKRPAADAVAARAFVKTGQRVAM